MKTFFGSVDLQYASYRFSVRSVANKIVARKKKINFFCSKVHFYWYMSLNNLKGEYIPIGVLYDDFGYVRTGISHTSGQVHFSYAGGPQIELCASKTLL